MTYNSSKQLKKQKQSKEELEQLKKQKQSKEEQLEEDVLDKAKKIKKLKTDKIPDNMAKFVGINLPFNKEDKEDKHSHLVVLLACLYLIPTVYNKRLIHIKNICERMEEDMQLPIFTEQWVMELRINNMKVCPKNMLF